MCRQSSICHVFGEGEQNISIDPTPGVMYKIQLHLFKRLVMVVLLYFSRLFLFLISLPCPWPEVPSASPGLQCLELPLPHLQQCSSPLHQPPLPLPSPLPPIELLYLRNCSPVSRRNSHFIHTRSSRVPSEKHPSRIFERAETQQCQSMPWGSRVL